MKIISSHPLTSDDPQEVVKEIVQRVEAKRNAETRHRSRKVSFRLPSDLAAELVIGERKEAPS